MPFFLYNQTASGGSFIGEMGYVLYVEAANEDEADVRAQSVGVYFDGCRNGVDCPCCGDRWTPAKDAVLPPLDSLKELLEDIPGALKHAKSFKLGVGILFSGHDKITLIHKLEDYLEKKIMDSRIPENNDSFLQENALYMFRLLVAVDNLPYGKPAPMELYDKILLFVHRAYVSGIDIIAVSESPDE